MKQASPSRSGFICGRQEKNRAGQMAGMAMTLTAVYMKVQEGYVAFIEELPGANTQGETLDEARENLNEAVALVLKTNRALVEQSLEGATAQGK